MRIIIPDVVRGELKPLLPADLNGHFDLTHGPMLFLRDLPERFAPAEVANNPQVQRTWELVGLHYFNKGQYHEALAIFGRLYEHLLAFQDETGSRCSKGTALVWMSECYAFMGYTAISCRFLMLTLIEDAIGGEGSVSPTETGVYFRLVQRGWLSDTDLKRYAREAYAFHQAQPAEALYPEWVLQQLDQDWVTQSPTAQEAGMFPVNLRYVARLIGRLGDGSGKTMEALAQYIMSCMPGCRTRLRANSPSTDYDLVCSLDGLGADFRSELGRYFVCECKDLRGPADYTAVAKFCRVLDSVKARFGILFSRHGITGEGKDTDASRELLKIFHDREIVVVVVNEHDLKQVAQGTNFISMLRNKYERVRLDLDERA